LNEKSNIQLKKRERGITLWTFRSFSFTNFSKDRANSMAESKHNKKRKI